MDRSWLCRSETPRRSRSSPTFVIVPNVVCRVSRRVPIFPGSSPPDCSASRQEIETTAGDLPGSRLPILVLVYSSCVPRSRVESHLLTTTIACSASAAILRLSMSPGTIKISQCSESPEIFIRINVAQLARHLKGAHAMC